MKEIFPEFYRPEDEEFQNLWSSCIFIFDTNVLLDLYRYSADSRSDFFDVLEHDAIRDRLWLPHQVAYEFQKNRLNVIITQRNQFLHVEQAFASGVANLVNDMKDKAEAFNRLNKLRKEPIIDTEGLLASLTKEVENIESQLREQKEALLDHNKGDIVRERIDKLFGSKIGLPYSLEETEKISRKGKERFSKKIPPGYVDYAQKIEGKDEADSHNTFNQFGDLIIWQQVIDYAEAANNSIVFVTGDVKEDWFERVKGQTVGSRPELLKEINDEASVNGYIYTIDSFYTYSKAYLQQEIRQDTVEEVQLFLNEDEIARQVNLRNFSASLDIQLQAFILPAEQTYIASEKLLKLVFPDIYMFHKAQLIERLASLLDSAQTIFGDDVRVEVWSLIKGGGIRLDASTSATDQSPSVFSDDEEDLIPDFRGDIDNVRSTFRGGEKISHPKFGEGTVVGVSGRGAREEIIIVFKGVGLKRLLLKYADVTLID